jgi:hypothetical protein
MSVECGTSFENGTGYPPWTKYSGLDAICFFDSAVSLVVVSGGTVDLMG